MLMVRMILALTLVWGLGACSDPSSASPEAIAAAHYVSGKEPSLTVITMRNGGSDIAEHTGLLINGSEQVLFDPAGNFRHPQAPRSGDVHYGINEGIYQRYLSFHARQGYYLEIQEVPVSLETADALIARAQSQGVTRQLFCASTVSEVLNDTPPFEGISVSMVPGSIARYFAKYPGVVTTEFHENDVGKN